MKIKAVAAGQFHTILIDENGGVWTAGKNTDGQLGRSDNVNDGAPNAEFKKVDGLENVKIVSAAGGLAHTILLDEDGNVWTAGNNVYGELGRQTADNVDSKFEKVTDGISGVKITAIAAGNYHSVLLDEEGNVWTVGSNQYGELGREPVEPSSDEFKKADLQGAASAKFVAAGNAFTVVIDSDGNTRTCGLKIKIGRDAEETENPQLLKVTNGVGSTKMIAAAAGGYHSILLDENGGIWSCGKNQSGQLCRPENFGSYSANSTTFAAVTDGMTQTMTFDEMKNTIINSDRLFTVTSAVREKGQLEYNLNGGAWVDGFTPRDFYYKDEGFFLPDASNIKKPGYTFVEWEISSLTDNPIKCSAKWSPNVYMVTFDANGGTVAQETMQVTYGEKLDQMPIPRYKGYLFRGWFAQKWGSRQYGDEKDHSTTTYDKTDDCTLYAHWEEAPMCTITFDPNGGTLTGAATCEEKLNECIRKPEEDPMRKGYSFEGWYKDADCTPTQRWDFDDPIPGNMTLYAGWRALPYRITVKPENGEQDIWIDADCDAAITEPILTRPGYIFAGWDKEFPAKMPAEDMTITALWTVCDHSGSTEAPTCTDSVVCTVCGGTVEALGHDFSEQESDADQHWDKCSRCDATANVEPHDWDNGVVTIPSTCVVAGEKTFTCGKCNATKIQPVDASGHSWGQEWQRDATHHWHECQNSYCDVKNDNSMKDGYGEHTGGKATCTEKAVCEICGKPYGDVNPDNHTGKEVWEQTETEHTKKWDCCGAVSAASEAHDWEDGVCKVCEYACEHKDGKATCTEKAVCDLCGEAYGALDGANHANLKHVEAKAATKEAEGNVEYWYCDGCGKYYSDAAATGEIAGADIVTKKLPNDPPAPKTGDSSNLLLWVALLFISGGVLTGATVLGKKKRFLTK